MFASAAVAADNAVVTLVDAVGELLGWLLPFSHSDLFPPTSNAIFYVWLLFDV